jgi:hypothetical protein
MGNSGASETDKYFSFNMAFHKIKTTFMPDDAAQSSIENRAMTARLLLDTYSNKKYAKWFAIADVKIHESGSYTVYKVIYRVPIIYKICSIFFICLDHFFTRFALFTKVCTERPE